MAPTRPEKGAKDQKPLDPALLIQLASAKLEEGDIETAYAAAQKALETTGEGGEHELISLNILGQICVEAGEIEDACACFLRAVSLDEDGSVDESRGGGPEKFLWLAQLSDNGGQESVAWFERGAMSLRGQIQQLADLPRRTAEQEALLEERKRKLAGTLCGVAEVYMTDLSWEADAEQRCEALVTEATMVAPSLAETWQTVANVRISQQKMEEARAALSRSLELWKDLPPQHADVPDFPTRVSLARLLLETEMEPESMEVLHRLVSDDDESVEAWYLGGWSQFISGEKAKEEGKPEDEWTATWRSAQKWLTRCRKLFAAQEYEDERLGAHAQELLEGIDKQIGPLPKGQEDEDDEWEEEDGSDEDEQMAG
ncbi:TPR domain-containing protein [Plectosphaerella cucumerina]|uniref:TPR domain-containing protein n=1 Tax=Plectosphaerella cucumerina TaxID=40658 RepID=A0A8K0X765_9PEZI|nr:TPR domain-containing protein [Plectosphaerella cucumerina]